MLKQLKKQGDFPGPQKNLENFNFISSLLFFLTSVFLILTVYDILRVNALIPISINGISLPSLIEAKTACTIFVSLIGLLLVRHHFLIGLRPYIVYECCKTKNPIHPELVSDAIIWQVKIRNVGLGLAMIKHYSLVLGIDNFKSDFELDNFKDTLQEINSSGLVYEKDYFLTNLTSGYAIPSKDEKIVFEIILPEGYKIKQLDLVLHFKGFLGGEYRKDIFLIPRRGIPKNDVSIDIVNLN